MRNLGPIARNLIFLTICAVGAVTFNLLLKPPAPPVPPAHPRSRASPAVGWLNDWRIAKLAATAQGKDILLEFTRPLSSHSTATATATSSATDLDSDAFLRPIGGAFVLLRLSLSQDALPEDVA